MIFWALAQRKKDKEKIQAEARAEGRAEERERIVREMAKRGIEIPPEILAVPAERE